MARVNSTGKETTSNFSPANGTGLAVRTAMKDVFESLRTLNSAAGDPSGTANLAAYQLHINTTDDLLKIRNGANSAFITVGDVTETNLGLLPRTGGSSAPMTGQFLAHNHGSSESTPDISFAVDPDTGIYRSAANTLGISCAGSNQFSFNTTLFESKSDITIEKTGADAALQLRTNSNSNNAIVDLASDNTTLGLDFGLRLMRTGGADGYSTLHHRSTSATANNLIINSQARSSGGIILQTGGDCTTTPETVSKSRWAVAHNGGILAGEAIRTNVDPVTASGNVGNAIKFVTASATEEYGSFCLAASAKDVVGIFNRTNTVGTICEFKYNATICGLVSTANGTTTSFVTNPSDRSLKKNFESWTENTLDLFKNIDPQKYNFISEDDTAEKNKGFIAQDIASSFPEAYFKNEDDKYMFNPSGMVVYLMKALQETVAKIETLETKVAALEAG